MAADLGEKEASEDTTEGEEKIHEDENEDDFSTGKRAKHSKKHKHKHSKKHKHKHKKRKHKKISLSRSRSKSSSRSRSRSPTSEPQEQQVGSLATKVGESGTVSVSAKQDSDAKANGVSGERDEPSPVIAECDSSFSFKLTKSPSGSVSPKELEMKESKATDTPNVENKINLGFPLKIETFLKNISKSPDVADQEVDKRSRSDSSTDPAIKPSSGSPKVRSRSRSVSKNKKRSRSPSEVKLRKRSRSHSRSRSRSRTQSRKSISISPKKYSSKKKSRSLRSPRSKSRTKSHSRSRSRSKSYNKNRNPSKSKSKSRSPSKYKHKDRSRSRSSSYSRKKSKRKERKSRSRSRTKTRSYNKRGRSRSRSQSYRDRRSRYDASPRRNKRNSSTDRKQHYSGRSRRTSSRSPRRRSRSVSRHRSRRKSPPRSPRRGRSRTPRRDRYRSRSRSRSGRYKHRSRSRSYSSRRRSRSCSRSRSRGRKRSKSKEKSNCAGNKNTRDEKGMTPAVISTANSSKQSAQDLVGKAPDVSGLSNKRSLAQLTEFCKKLTEARGIETPGNETEVVKQEEKEEEDAAVEISHPFLVAPKRDITIPQVIFPVKLLPPTSLVSSSKPLTEQFPVSCGTKHHEKEEEETNVNQIIPDIDGSAMQTQQVFQAPQQNQQKLDISSLVVKRMDAQRKLHADPNDLDAMLSLQEVELKLNNWCQSNVKPGQYTGQLAKTMMPKEKFNSGYQAWARKDMFQNLNPVCGGVGMKLLQKMGWEPGQVLGKRGEGMAEPIALTVKVDRKGLSSTTERPAGKKGVNKTAIDLQGKHPISSLQEYCARRKWQVPEFTLIFDEGPPHSKQFLYKVAVNGYEYQHPVISGNKKHAKAQAAVAALKGLGLVPEDADY